MLSVALTGLLVLLVNVQFQFQFILADVKRDAHGELFSLLCGF